MGVAVDLGAGAVPTLGRPAFRAHFAATAVRDSTLSRCGVHVSERAWDEAAQNDGIQVDHVTGIAAPAAVASDRA